jgi:hypothetical protein
VDEQKRLRVGAMRDFGLAHVRVHLEGKTHPVVDRQRRERLAVETDHVVVFEERNVRGHFRSARR